MNYGKFKKIFLSLKIILFIITLWIILPIISYGRTSTLASNSVDVYSGKYITLGQFQGHNWSITSYDSNIVTVTKTTVGGGIQAIHVFRKKSRLYNYKNC